MSNALTIGGITYTIEPPTGRKANQVIRMLRLLSRQQPHLAGELAKFRTRYAAENFDEYDRVQAALRNPPRVLSRIDEDGIEHPIFDERKPGVAVMLPSPVDRITDEAWEKAGHTWRVPRQPNAAEVMAALFDEALEVAEDTVYRLVAVLTFTNAEVAEWAKSGALKDKLTERVDKLLDDGDLGDLIELGILASEVIDDQINRKLKQLGDRVGKAKDRLGGRFLNKTTNEPTPTDAATQSSSTQNSSTDSDASTDGNPTSSSTPGTDSSSTSPSSSSTSESNGSSPKETVQPA